MNNLKIMSLKGKDIIPYIPNLASLRIAVFKEYPYLYEGDLNYEKNYLQTYVNCSESLLVLVLDGNNIVGASTAIPLEFETVNIQESFTKSKMNIQDIFYFGESILLPQYRGQGIYKHFFVQREKAARQYGAKITTFCGVERSQNDPRRPPHYLPLDDIWKNFGYEKHPELCVYFEWKEIGNPIESRNPLIFWLKKL